MMNEFVNLNVICITILIFELFCLFSSKNKIIWFKDYYLNGYLFILILEFLIVLLQPEIFSFVINDINIKTDSQFVGFHLVLVTLFILIYNFVVSNRSMPIFYNFGLFCYLIGIVIIKSDLFCVLDNYIYEPKLLLVYIFLIFVLLLFASHYLKLMCNVLLSNSDLFYGIIFYILIIYNTIFYTELLLLLSHFDFSRFTLLMHPNFAFLFLLVTLPLFILLCYLVFSIYNCKKVIILIFTFLSFSIIICYFYSNWCILNYEPFLVNFQYFNIRINYMFDEKFFHLSNVWKNLKFVYGSNLDNEMYKIIEYFSKKTDISLDVLEHDFRCAVHVLYQRYLKLKYLI